MVQMELFLLVRRDELGKLMKFFIIAEQVTEASLIYLKQNQMLQKSKAITKMLIVN